MNHDSNCRVSHLNNPVRFGVSTHEVSMVKFIRLAFRQDLEQTLLLQVSHALSRASEAEFHPTESSSSALY